MYSWLRRRSRRTRPTESALEIGAFRPSYHRLQSVSKHEASSVGEVDEAGASDRRLDTDRLSYKEMAKLGFLGLGLMGYPMARNLIRAGHDVAFAMAVVRR